MERISISEYRNNFILKGGMLVAAIVGVDLRSTIDMDATIKSYPVDRKSIEDLFKSIITTPVDDGVNFELKKIESIREEDQYNGYRVSIEAFFDNARIPIKVDITTGDEIIPKEVTYRFNLLLENRSIDIFPYNIETVIAEKFETIITRGITNTRMRDFYDIYILLKLQGDNIRDHVLSEAVSKVTENRKSSSTLIDAQLILNELKNDNILQDHWLIYQKKNSYADYIVGRY